MEVTVRIEADREVCVGAGLCVLAAPEVFDQDDDGLVVVRDPASPAGPAVLRARALCPSGALRLSPAPA